MTNVFLHIIFIFFQLCAKVDDNIVLLRVTLQSGEMEWVNFLMEALRQSQTSRSPTHYFSSKPQAETQKYKYKNTKIQIQKYKYIPPISNLTLSNTLLLF